MDPALKAQPLNGVEDIRTQHSAEGIKESKFWSFFWTTHGLLFRGLILLNILKYEVLDVLRDAIYRALQAMILILGAGALSTLALFKSSSLASCKVSQNAPQQAECGPDSTAKHTCNKDCIFTKAGKCATSWSSSTISQHYQTFEIRHRLLHRLQTTVKTIKACENKIEIARERRTAANKKFDEAFNTTANLGPLLKERQAYQAAMGLRQDISLGSCGDVTNEKVDLDILRAGKTMEMAEQEMHKADVLREVALEQMRYVIHKI